MRAALLVLVEREGGSAVGFGGWVERDSSSSSWRRCS